MFLYILIRFRKWQYGLGAVIALFHDVLMILSAFTLLKNFAPFSLEVNEAFLAAVMTIIGYSINDTVVVYDRIREYLKIHHGGDATQVINNALNSTMSRTI